MRSINLLCVLIVVILTSCSTPQKKNQEQKPLKVTETNDYIFSTLVSKGNELILEEHYNGKTRNSLCDVQSLTKGLMSILVGIAIDKGDIESVDDPIEKYLKEEFRALDNPGKKKISIRHLLNQTSGLSWKGYLEHEAWLGSENPIAFVLEKELETQPGEAYNYNSGATHLLSVIVSRASEQTTLDFAKENLFGPLGIENIEWTVRGSGYHDGSGLGLRMLPKDLMSLGLLLLNDGTWAEEQLVSKEWVELLFDENQKLSTDWGLKNSVHGFCWYKAQLNGHEVDYGMGYGGQFIILLRESDLVIVTTHNHDTPNGIEQQIKFLNKDLPVLINKFIQ